MDIAINLLVIGMITVFVILSLVVLSGNILIFIVNKYFPTDRVKYAFDAISEKPPVAHKILTVILTAIEIYTQGKGKVTSIEKTDEGKGK